MKDNKFTKEELNELFGRKEASPENIARLGELWCALGFQDEDSESYDENDSSKPNRSSIKVGLGEKGVSFDYLEDDMKELELFKAVAKLDQDKFTELMDSSEIDSQMKIYTLSVCKVLAASFRDIDALQFLIDNDINISEAILLADTFETHISPFQMLFYGSCNNQYFDQELVDLFLNNGVDLDVMIGGSTPYISIINDAPEEVSIKFLDYINDINQIQYTRCESVDNDDNITDSWFSEISYLSTAIEEKKFGLARALIEKGADLDVSRFFNMESIFYTAVRSNNKEFIKFLIDFDKSILEKEGGRSLYQAVAISNYEICKIFVDAGVDVNYVESGVSMSYYAKISGDKFAKLLVASGRLIWGDIDEPNVEYYNQIRDVLDFENLVELDLAQLEHLSSQGESDTLNKDQVSTLLAYYLHGYKQQDLALLNEDQQISCDLLATEVLTKLNLYVQDFWPQIMEIAHDFSSDRTYLPAEMVKAIGEFILEDWIQEALALGQIEVIEDC